MICKIRELDNFDYSQHVDALIENIKKSWNVSARPKGYNEFIKDYKDFKGQEELDETEMLKEFDGCDDSGARSFPFPIRISTPHVAYDDICQGRKPLETLIGAIFGYGIAYGQRYEQVGDNTDTSFRLSMIDHCWTGMMCSKNEKKRDLYYSEFDELINNKTRCLKIIEKYNRLRESVDKELVIPLIKKMMTRIKKGEFTLIQNKFKIQGSVWSTLHSMCVGRIKKENPVFIELKKELKQSGIILKLKSPRGTHPYIFTFKKIMKGNNGQSRKSK